MQRFTFLGFFLLYAFSTAAQLNVVEMSNVTYSPRLNDIWGYESGGSEYALVGLRNGVNILDVTDPANPADLGTATGPTSTWRDIKTYGDYAYATNETGSGLLVIDLSGLPTPITSSDWHYWEPNITELGGDLTDCHNIFIDGNGYGYLVGCNRNSGGVIYIDLFSDPLGDGSPVYVDHGPSTYAHDVYVENDIMYTSDIYEGKFTIYDVSNKAATIFQGDQTTPDDFTHNAWPNAAGDVLYTTDEVGNAPTAAYDISDPNDIQLLDEFRPLASINTGVVPHNVHVLNDYLIISHYSDGVVIVDASVPENLIEVGNYDTSSSGSGAWGAYPFLSSGTILVSDINDGCFILTPTYVRAARLHGKVTDSNTGSDLNGVLVSIDASQVNMEVTGFNGDYKTGIATAGTYDATFSRSGYHTQTISVTLTNGTVTTLDVQLVPTSLAIELVGFEVEKNADKGVDLYWKALSDDASVEFQIERSTNGINFEVIGSVADEAPSLVAKDYQYTDETAPFGKLYYRLMMVEPSGESTISPVKNLDHFSASAGGIKVYPNPVSNGGRVVLEATELRAKNLTMEVYNGVGTLVDQVALDEEANQWFYDTSLLSTGVYFLKITNDGQHLLLEPLRVMD